MVRVRVVVVVMNHRYPEVRNLSSPETKTMIEQRHWNRQGRWASASPCPGTAQQVGQTVLVPKILSMLSTLLSVVLRGQMLLLLLLVPCRRRRLLHSLVEDDWRTELLVRSGPEGLASQPGALLIVPAGVLARVWWAPWGGCRWMMVLVFLCGYCCCQGTFLRGINE